MSIEIVREFSAIASRPAPRSIRRLAPELAKEAERVADVGCGYLSGTVELLGHHRHVYAVDTKRQAGRIEERLKAIRRQEFAGFRVFDDFAESNLRLGGAYVANVLHTIPEPEDRVELLRAVQRNLRRAGFVVVDVPSYEHYYAQRMSAENAYGDGHVFSRGGKKAAHTFYRFTTTVELDDWAGEAGLVFERKVPDNHHHVRIYRRA